MTRNNFTEPYTEVLQILEGRRSQSRRVAQDRYSEVSANCAGFSDIESRIRNVGLKYNRMVLSGELSADEAVEKINAQISPLVNEKNMILENAGYGSGYLLPSHVCHKCSDTGFQEGPGGERVRCACLSQLLIERLYQGSNIAPLGEACFEKFNPSLFSDKADYNKNGYRISPRENMIKIRDASFAFIDAFKSGLSKDFYFFGRTGTGKTFVSSCIAKRFLDEGFTVLYMSAPSLFNTITEYRMKAFQDDQYKDAPFRGIVESSLLIIDDLGTESMTDTRYSEFLTLLNTRSGAAGGVSDGATGVATGGATGGARSTILSTNMNLRQLRDAYDERIVSRIIGNFEIIPFFGDDIRLARN